MSTIQFRRGTDAEAAANNVVLARGEPGWTDEGTFKVGDGSTAWNDLDEVGTGTYSRLIASQTVDTATAADLDSEGTVVSNVSGLTDVVGATIPADTLAKGGLIRAHWSGRLYNDSGAAVDMGMAVVWGAGYAITRGSTTSISASANKREWSFDLVGVPLWVNPGTASPDDDVRFTSEWKVGFPGSGEHRPVAATLIGHGLSVRNVEEDLALMLQVDFSAAHADTKLICDTFFVEAIKQAS